MQVGQLEWQVPSKATRTWRNDRVDAGLHDEWLERLNTLTCLDLISICEGHRTQAGADACPHINLRLKWEYIPPLLAIWYADKAKIAAKTNKLIHMRGTHYNVSLSDEFYPCRQGLHNHVTYVVHLECNLLWRVGAADPVVTKWFDGIVTRIERFDRMLCRLLAVKA